MSKDVDNDALLTLIQQTMDEKTQHTEVLVEQRLRQMRREVVTNIERSANEVISIPLWGACSNITAYTSIALILSALWLGSSRLPEQTVVESEQEIVAMVNEADLYKQLDFYLWLEDEADIRD